MSLLFHSSDAAIAGALADAAKTLEQAGVDAPRLDARLLLAHVLECDQATLISDSKCVLSAEQRECYAGLVMRRARREPVSRIIGRREFWSLEFAVDPYTLDPRPDSECLIEAALEICRDGAYPLRILDLGTGTGCLLISLLSEYPAARGVGLDCSEQALAVAARNAARLGVSERIGFVQADMMCAGWQELVGGGFDLVVANPPYIPTGVISGLAPEVAQFEPGMALDGGADGLDFYRAITNSLDSLLSASGVALLEIGAGQERSVISLLHAAGMLPGPQFSDLNGVERVVTARVTGTVPRVSQA